MRYLQINLVPSPPVVVLALSGEINALSFNDLREAYQQAVVLGQPGLVLDFSSVEYLNSAGLAGIIQLAARAGSRGIMLLACGLPPHYQQIFEVMKLTDFISLAENRSAAANAVAAELRSKPAPAFPPG
jgi:anti-anti-sigma factor